MQPTAASNTSTDRFLHLRIEQAGGLYPNSYFDEINSRLISEQLRNDKNDSDDLVLVIPEDTTTLVTVGIHSLLALLQSDIANGTSSTLEDIKEGDSVGLIENRVMHPGVFLRREFINGRNYYCVRRTDLSSITVEKIPEGREWRIQPYSAAASLKSKRSGKIYGKAIENILGLPVGGLKAFQKSKLLVVALDKRRIIEAIRDIKIEGDSLESIFPIADYTSTTEWKYVGYFGVNNIKQAPLIGLVANFDMAVDIALKDPSYKLLIIDGAGKLRGHYGSIERLNAETRPRKVLCLLHPSDEEELKTLNAMGVKSFVWKRSDFKGRDKLVLQPRKRRAANPFERHAKVMNRLAGSDIHFLEVKLPAEIDIAVSNAYKILYSLSRDVPPLPESGILIRWGISMLNSWLQLPFKIDIYHLLLKKTGTPDEKRLDIKFNEFTAKIRSSYGLLIPSDKKADGELLLANLKIIFNYFLTNNPKRDMLEAYLKHGSDSETDVYCCQPLYTVAFNARHSESNIHARNIQQLATTTSKRGIVTGWSSRRNTAAGFLAPVDDLSFLLYHKELESMIHVYKTHPSSPESSIDSNMRETIFGKNEVEETMQTTSLTEAESVESLLNYISTKFNMSPFSDYDSTNVEHSRDNVEAHQILFEDGTTVYLDGASKLDKIDRAAKRITRSTLEKIGEGDELVFANSERSMFEELLAILQQSEEYREIAMSANIWKDALQDYVRTNAIQDKQLVDIFKMVGCPRTISTFRSWLSGTTIGPSQDNYAAITAIVRITQDDRLVNRQDEVINACKMLHALHVKTGWLLVRNIINSTVEPDDEELNEETKRRLLAYSASTRLVTVKAISEKTYSVPRSEVSKLQEAYI